MKTKMRKSTVGVVALLFSTTLQMFAIEGLHISVQCSNVVLSWPSTENETYIVQHRQALTDSNGWQTLTSSLPADSGTNLTFYVHSNVVLNPFCGCGGGLFAAMVSSGNSLSLAEAMAETRPPVPMVMAANGSGTGVPLALYPPGVDLTGFLIFDPATGETLSGAGYVVQPLSPLNVRANGLQPMDEPFPDGGDGGTLAEPETGFYRVVRHGIRLWGITNGMVLSGQVPLSFEFGNADTNRFIDQMFLTDNDSDENLSGSSFPVFPLEDDISRVGIWDTLQATNGTYLLQLGALLDDGSVVMDALIAVTISNSIYLPDPWNVGGQAIYVGFKTVYTNGTWHLDVYDDQDAYLGYLDGDIAEDGNCNYPGIPGPGFSLDNTDGYGNQNPTPAYKLVMAAKPLNTPPPYQMATNKVFIEPAWNYYTRAVTCYQQVFPSWHPAADDLRYLMEALWGAEEIYHQNLVGGLTTVHEVNGMGWGTVTYHLANPLARDFVYFGHGSGTALANGGLTLAMVHSLLGNNLKDPLTATNMHPYRYVFLDGCNTADGDWPQAFGIPKKKGMTVADFVDKRGIRPRAFMGWNRTKAVGTGIISGGQLNQDHINYVTKFWNWWGNGSTGMRPVKEAIRQAELVAPFAGGGMMLYGAENLYINY